MLSTRRRLLAGIGCLVVSGCGRSITVDETPEVSEATIAVFLPDAANPCRSRLPFPSDLARNNTTGTLDLPFCTTDAAETLQLKAGLRTLGGYALNTPIYTTFSENLDADSLEGNVQLFRNGSPTPVPALTIWSPADRRVYVRPVEPLLESSTYTVVVSNDVLDANGGNIVSDQVFTFLKSTSGLVDFLNYSTVPALDDQSAASLEPLRVGFAPMFNMLATLGHARPNIAVAWSFTTQAATAQMAGLLTVADSVGATFVHEDSIAANAHPLVAAAGIPVTALCEIHSGRVTFGSLMRENGFLGPVAGTDDADYILTTPRDSGGGCTAWNQARVVVFMHGLGRCKNDALALANTFASAGFATLSVDGPRAGGRTVNSLGDQDLDGCPDQGATPELIAVSGSPNPFSVRDQLREWGLEASQVVSEATAQPWTLVGEDGPGAAAQVSIVGHSWGGIAAVLAGQITPEAVAVAVTATTGKLGANFLPLIEATIRAGLSAAGIDPDSALGLGIIADQLNQAGSAFTWALEPADPVFSARQYDTTPVLVQVVSSGSPTGDAPLHGTANQAALAAAFGQDSDVGSFTLACDDGEQICDDASAVVGSMLQPCVAEMTDPKFLLAYNKLVAMQTQLVSFLASGGACVGALGPGGCTPIVDTNPVCP